MTLLANDVDALAWAADGVLVWASGATVTVVIPAEDRCATVDAEDRTVWVAVEDRTVVIPGGA